MTIQSFFPHITTATTLLLLSPTALAGDDFDGAGSPDAPGDSGAIHASSADENAAVDAPSKDSVQDTTGPSTDGDENIPSPAPPSGKRDRVRFRGGIGLAGGPLINSSGGDPLGVIGFQGELGVQINNLIGVYVVPEMSGVFGDRTYGGQLSGALMVDFTPFDEFTVGVGYDTGVYGFYAEPTDSGALARTQGGRLRASYQPVVSTRAGRRSALRIGLDLRFLAAQTAAIETGLSTTGSLRTSFVFAPMVTIGYLAF